MGTKPPSGPHPISSTRAGDSGIWARTKGQTAASHRSSGVTPTKTTRSVIGPPAQSGAGGWPGPGDRPTTAQIGSEVVYLTYRIRTSTSTPQEDKSYGWSES